MNHLDQLIAQASQGQPAARQELYLRTWLMPELEEVLTEVFGGRPVLVLPADELAQELTEDQGPCFGIVEWQVVQRTVARVMVDASEPEGVLMGVADKLAATRELRDGLETLLSWLDARLDRFHDQLDLLEATQGYA